MDGRQTDGRTTEPAYTISSPRAFSSGELKIWHFPPSEMGGKNKYDRVAHPEIAHILFSSIDFSQQLKVTHVMEAGT